MFSVFWTNHGYTAEPRFATVDQALVYGTRQCFDFQVQEVATGALVASWTIFGGTRRYEQE